MKLTELFKPKGFTLVEAIVSGAISIFVVLAAIALFKMNANQISGSTVRSLTKMQYQTAIDAIGAMARKATLISQTDANFTDNDTFADSSNAVYFLDTSGTVLGGFRRNGNFLREYKGGVFTNFKVGSKNIQIDTTKSLFEISADRKSVVLNLTVFGMDGSSKDTVLSKKEKFQCRN